MRRIVFLSLAVAVVFWIAYGWVLLAPADNPVAYWLERHLGRPENMAQLGDSFGALNALFSSIALILALAAILIQSKHQTVANAIGGYSARQQFLIAECGRLENVLEQLKQRGQYDPELFRNTAEKKKRYLFEVNAIDRRIKDLLARL